ncbi:MAG: hypothetical protein AAF389_10215 [Gemmatimonadota bacterium]
MWGAIACVCLLQTVPDPTTDRLPPDLIAAEVRAVEVDSDGAVWVGVRDRGLLEMVGEVVRPHADPSLPEGIADLLGDSSGLWAVGLGGVARRTEGRWHAVELPNAPRVVFSVTSEPDSGRHWFGTNRGAALLHAGAWTVLTEADGLPHAVVHQVLVEPDGVVWLLCRRGLARLVDGTIEVFRPDLNFRRAVVGPDGRPWFGTSGGLLRWNGEDFDVDLDGIVPYPLVTTVDGSVWAGSASDGLLRYAAGVWGAPIPALEDVEVFDVARAPDGAIWVASQDGLRRIPPGASR